MLIGAFLLPSGFYEVWGIEGGLGGAGLVLGVGLGVGLGFVWFLLFPSDISRGPDQGL